MMYVIINIKTKKKSIHVHNDVHNDHNRSFSRQHKKKNVFTFIDSVRVCINMGLVHAEKKVGVYFIFVQHPGVGLFNCWLPFHCVMVH